MSHSIFHGLRSGSFRSPVMCHIVCCTVRLAFRWLPMILIPLMHLHDMIHCMLYQIAVLMLLFVLGFDPDVPLGLLPKPGDVSHLLLYRSFGLPVVTDDPCTAHEFARHDTLHAVSDCYVCIEAVEFFASGKLLPVGSINFCRTISVVEPVFSFASRQPTVFSLRLSQFCTVFVQYRLFSSLSAADLRSFVSTIAMDRTVLRNVQLVQNSFSVAPSVQLLDQCPISSSSSDDSMYFDNHDTAATSFSLPATATPDVMEALAQLRASIEQIKGRDEGDKLRDTLLLHLHDIEKKFTARFDEQDRVLRALRKDSHDQKHLLSLDIKSSQKQLSAQAATAAIDVVDVRREVKELNAKVTYLDEQVAATRNDLLEFRATAQETLNHITDQLSELVNYINRGGNDKKGEDSSSRGPQPPPDDQGRPGGGSASRGSGSGGDGRRKGDSGRSSKRRRSGESPPRNIRYGPYPPSGVPKRSAEHWVLGKKDF
ncbi:hypothetical protein F511_36035 [Dorcoceras hygrometricum]|uniref:Uncharacterized protein n=1 Tax=Dorcoceras hygrometricum TaxID=472368 RepID=A0A2Z7CLU4_9LAMI|nr:hypothetical protein F511_36035 [Dorcoceras hygrometricum]